MVVSLAYRPREVFGSTPGQGLGVLPFRDDSRRRQENDLATFLRSSSPLQLFGQLIDGARLREQGDILTGEAFIVPRRDTELLGRLDEARQLATGIDWRLHDVNIVLVRSVE